MRRALAPVAAAIVAGACGGRGADVTEPVARPAIQLVRCAPAIPAPVVAGGATSSTVDPDASPPGPVDAAAPRANPWGSAAAAAPSAAPAAAARAWTPYAIETAPPIATAPLVAHAAEAAIRARLGALDACFTAPEPLGSLRAMLEIDAAGALTAARVGGLGDRGGEDCLARALEGLHVVMPTTEGVEVACDLARGEARPWRVALDAGYDVIEVTARAIRHGTTTLGLTATEPAPLPSGPTYLVVAAADAPGALLDVAASWAFEGDTTLIALRAPAGPPALIGASRTAYSAGDVFDDALADRATLTVSARMVSSCAHAAVEVAALSDPHAVDQLVTSLAASCRQRRCASTLRVAFDGDALARDLAAVVAATRRAGFERVLLGGSPGCDSEPIEDETP